MANLGSKVLVNSEYEDVEVLLGVALDDGAKYVIQNKAPLWICESVDKPEANTGFLFPASGKDLIGYTKNVGEKLWVKAESQPCYFNIAEGE